MSKEEQQIPAQQQQQFQQQEITPQILQKFQEISLQTKDIMSGFSQQAKEFNETVGGFTKSIQPNAAQMFPAEKIEEFTKYYQEQMKDVNLQAMNLEQILKQEEEQRGQLQAEMDAMFEKLERLQEKLKLKKEKQRQKQKQQQKSQEQQKAQLEQTKTQEIKVQSQIQATQNNQQVKQSQKEQVIQTQNNSQK